MLRAVPRSLFSWDFEIFDGDASVALLDLSWFREKGRLTLHGVDFEIGREGLMSGTFFLRKGGEPVATAEKPSAFLRSFDVAFGRREYRLQALSPLTRRFVLRDGDRVIGSISPLHLFTRKADVDLPEDFPLEVQVFITWLVVILWKRAHRSE